MGLYVAVLREYIHKAVRFDLEFLARNIHQGGRVFSARVCWAISDVIGSTNGNRFRYPPVSNSDS